MTIHLPPKVTALLASNGPAGTAQQSREPNTVSRESGNSEKRDYDLKRAAKDMESLFAYQLLKTMRETSQVLSGEGPGHGSDTYMSLFDMEVSKILAERGLGLQDAILKWLDRSEEKVDR